MIAVSFENCPGILHEGDGDIGVIMCSAQGFEELCARKDWRLLAQSIADLGLPVLRFDYAGTADAPGGDEDPGRLDAWRASLDAAVAFMRREVGVREIVLVGLRLGATLAAQIADKIHGFVALHPVVSGKAYARELGVLSKIISHVEGAAAPADGLAVAGFLTTSETLAALNSIDLRKSQRAPARDILICAPQDAMGAEALAVHWRQLGAAVDCVDFSGYGAWISDPTTSRRPELAFSHVVKWLEQNIAPRAKPRAAPFTPLNARVVGVDFVEQSHWFGAGHNLFGVLCEPARPRLGASTVVVANAGRNGHIGWARASVNMARALAALGHASLRIDVAGIGDAPDIEGRNPQVMYCDEPIEDLRAALDFLAARGFEKFCVVGLCSGAHLAFHTALRDARIERLVMANLQRFIWKNGDSLEIAIQQSYRSSDHYKRHFFRAETWKRMARGEVAVAGIARALFARVVEKIAARKNGERASVRGWLRNLSNRGARLLLVYADSDGGVDELTRHFGAGGRDLAKFPGASLAFIANADHNLTPRAARDRLTALTADFLERPPASRAESAVGGQQRSRARQAA